MALDVEFPKKKQILFALYILCGVLLLLDFVVDRHPKVPGEELFGFHALAGFVAFSVIVLCAKALRSFIKRDEDYYGESSVNGEKDGDPQ